MSQLTLDTSYPIGQLTPSIVLYEPSFEGWLSAVFYVYEHRLQHEPALQLFAQDDYAPSLIAQAVSVHKDEDKAERVLVKLNKLLVAQVCAMSYGDFCPKKTISAQPCFM